jgi:hypothetical protein
MRTIAGYTEHRCARGSLAAKLALQATHAVQHLELKPIRADTFLVSILLRDRDHPWVVRGYRVIAATRQQHRRQLDVVGVNLASLGEGNTGGFLTGAFR